MVQECYDWVWKLAGYLIFMTAVLQLVPGEKDRKYIHFFTGLVLIILIASPVIKFFTSDDLFVQFQDQYDAMETQVEAVSYTHLYRKILHRVRKTKTGRWLDL